MYLLDTNICIYSMKGAVPLLNERILSHDPWEICISAITVYELHYGAAKSNWGERTRQALSLFLVPFTILPFTPDDAIIAGKLRAHLEKAGTMIGPYDLQIAAQGLSRGFTVITHNTGEFTRVPGLSVEDRTIEA